MPNPIPSLEQLLQSATQHHKSGRSAQAETLYREILRQDPRHAVALHLLGVLAHQAGRHDIADDLIRQSIAIRPNSPEAYNDLADVLRFQGRFDEAIAACRRAIALKPDFPDAFNNLGIALRCTGQLDEAIAACRHAIKLKGDYPQAHNALGNALGRKGQLGEAIAAYRQAIALKPDYAEACNNLAIALSDKGQPDLAIAAFRQAIFFKPNQAEIHGNLGSTLKEAGRLDEAIAAFRQALALNPALTETHSNLVYDIHFHPAYDARNIARELQSWNRQHAIPLSKFIQPHSNDRNPDRRLRIGYVSPDFREHPVGRFLLPLLANHDKSQVEVFAYATQTLPDAMTPRLRADTDAWQNIAALSDANAADLIRRDRIDILVDLTMHMANNRLLIFARKPAPVQVTYLAYCSSTGLQTIDYRLSDPYLDPPGTDESIYTEQTIRLPETYWCYQPPPGAPEVGPLPALSKRIRVSALSPSPGTPGEGGGEGLLLESRESPHPNPLPEYQERGSEARAFITFGCLNNFCKVSDPTLAAWAKLLLAHGKSQLLLHSYEGSHRQRAMQRLNREGIDPQRVRFVGHAPLLDYLKSYNQIDIALDTFPYGGGTTTCDALWMGVPVVSLSRNTAVSRGGLSILSNVGLPELVARSQEQYVQIAHELANDLPRLTTLRSTLRSRMEQSPLMNAPRFARNIETAYRQMWRTWCSKNTAPR